jgi:hypothetical protein
MTEAAETITISLLILNWYGSEPHEVSVSVDEVRMPAPQAKTRDALTIWAQENILPLTGTERTPPPARGLRARSEQESGYTATVTSCSDPDMVGRRFDEGGPVIEEWTKWITQAADNETGQ